MWKAPNRPKGEISQSYNDGVVDVFSVHNVAQAGYAPVKELLYKVTLRYEERRMGINRYYSSMQAQMQIDRVIRVQKSIPINTQDVVVEHGEQYRVELVQVVPDVYPASLDLTLSKVKQKGGGL